MKFKKKERCQKVSIKIIKGARICARLKFFGCAPLKGRMHQAAASRLARANSFRLLTRYESVRGSGLLANQSGRVPARNAHPQTGVICEIHSSSRRQRATWPNPYVLRDLGFWWARPFKAFLTLAQENWPSFRLWVQISEFVEF